MKLIRILILIIIISILVSSSVVVFAHPGRLDANGGHYNHSTGEYHYHQGLHIDDNSPSGSENKNYNNVTTDQSSKNKNSVDVPWLKEFFSENILLVFCLLFLLITSAWDKIQEIKHNKNKPQSSCKQQK